MSTALFSLDANGEVLVNARKLCTSRFRVATVFTFTKALSYLVSLSPSRTIDATPPHQHRIVTSLMTLDNMLKKQASINRSGLCLEAMLYGKCIADFSGLLLDANKAASFARYSSVSLLPEVMAFHSVFGSYRVRLPAKTVEVLRDQFSKNKLSRNSLAREFVRAKLLTENDAHSFANNGAFKHVLQATRTYLSSTDAGIPYISASVCFTRELEVKRVTPTIK